MIPNLVGQARRLPKVGVKSRQAMRLPYNSPAFPLLGRRTNSPPQFGQTAFIAFVHSRQNVHSYVHMYASPAGSSLAPHFSHSDFIINAIVTFQFVARPSPKLSLKNS